MDVHEEREIAESDLEKMLGVLQKIGNNWPPYPQDFEIPDGIKFMRMYKDYSDANRSPILGRGIYGGLQIGDRFNAVPLPKKRKRGRKYSERHQRIYQFFFIRERFFGHVVLDESLSGADVLEKGQVRKDMVYRFEIVSIDKQKHVFLLFFFGSFSHNQNKNINSNNCNNKYQYTYSCRSSYHSCNSSCHS